MPIYEYKCKECGKEFEELVPIGIDKNPSCPSCSSENTEKKFSIFGSLGAGCGNSGFT
ncbi:MAG: zinc ribbon domain-containing protein [Fibrobacter sp.]|nr:zinc ribbon domain-containing protein [Fibrobacter sp.]